MDDHQPNLVADCEMMLHFALDEGAELGETLRVQIADLDRWLKSNGQPTLSGLPSRLIPDAAPRSGPIPGTDASEPDPITQLFHVHGQLAKLISPATPSSLRATDIRRLGLSRIRDLPIVVKSAITAAAICMLGFFITLCAPSGVTPGAGAGIQARATSNPSSAQPPTLTYLEGDQSSKMTVRSLSEGINDKGFWNSIFGAGLGAAFYILLKTQRYLVNRSYDPKYNNVYLTRFAAGVVSGFVLSNFAKTVLGNPETGLASLTPGMIALLGGFSAEAVEQILRRMIEVMVTFVRGDGSAQAKVDFATARAELAAEQFKRDSAVRQKLSELTGLQASDPGKLTQAVAEIHSLLK